MSRVARVAPKGYIYHILARGNNRKNVFKEEADYRKYIDIILRYKEKFLFKLYHYVLMTNHVHLLIETPKVTISKIMQLINFTFPLLDAFGFFNRLHLTSLSFCFGVSLSEAKGLSSDSIRFFASLRMTIDPVTDSLCSEYLWKSQETPVISCFTSTQYRKYTCSK